MTTQTVPNTLNWVDLVPPQTRHLCDCDHCDMVGELEERDWPTLVTVERAGASYVTDRYMMVRAERAPVTEDYEGVVIAGPTDLGAGWSEAVTDLKPENLWFRDATLQAMKQAGWRMVQLDHASNVGDEARKRVGIVDADGEHVGWAIGSVIASEGAGSWT